MNNSFNTGPVKINPIDVVPQSISGDTALQLPEVVLLIDAVTIFKRITNYEIASRWAIPRGIDAVVKIDITQFREALKSPLFNEILMEKGVMPEKVAQLRLEAETLIDKKADEFGIKLTDETRTSLLNLMILVAKKMDEQLGEEK